ncbi:MAG: alpha/beta hydrolase family protein, partial [Chitinophagaceae bacterium]
NMSDTDSLFNDLITRSGYAFMRVEKPGLGDSEGPDCSEADYEAELAAYKAAFKAMKKMDFIDTSSIFVLGISIGSASAPLVFQDENIKGFIVTGGFYKTWYEHMLEIERRRLALIGNQPGEITTMMRKYVDFYNDYL